MGRGGTLPYMYRLLVWASVLGSLLVVATFVPFGGRTLAERFSAAPSGVAFVEQSARDLAAAVERLWGERPDARREKAHASASPAKGAGRAPARAGAGGAKGGATPQERHTDAERSALDRLVAERSGSSQ